VEDAPAGQMVSAIWGSGAGDVWAVGGHDVLHSSGDGTWRVVRDEPGEQLQAVFGADGWVFVGGLACAGGICQGGVLLRSADGGVTWQSQALGAGVSGFAAADGVLYVDSAGIYSSTDHFATLQAVPLTWATSIGVFAAEGGGLFAYGAMQGAAIRRTLDGGQSWSTVYEGFSGSRGGHADGMARGQRLIFSVANGCSVPACLGAVLRSGDGGDTWTLAATPQDYVYGVWAPGDDEVYVGGTQLLRSTDEGASFTPVTLPMTGMIRAIWAASANEVYVAGDGGIVRGRR
jgi:hypothetical protein